MPEKMSFENAVNEVKELKALFERIKADSEEFFARSKVLSESGVAEASELIADTKETWEKLREGFTNSSFFANLFGQLVGSKTGMADVTPAASKSAPKNVKAKSHTLTKPKSAESKSGLTKKSENQSH